MFSKVDEIDPVLAELVRLIDGQSRPGTGLRITLTTEGLLMAGKIIPAWQWLDEVEQQTREALVAAGADDEVERNAVLRVFRNAANQGLEESHVQSTALREALESLPARYQEALLDMRTPAYIHLSNVKAYPGSDVPLSVTGAGWYWRGRLAEISGWTFGEMGPDGFPDTARKGHLHDA